MEKLQICEYESKLYLITIGLRNKPKKKLKKKNYLKTNVMRRHHTKFMWYNNIGTKGEVYNSTGLPQETRKFWNKQLTSYLKELEKEHMEPKVSRRKEIIMIRAEINAIETKKQ